MDDNYVDTKRLHSSSSKEEISSKRSLLSDESTLTLTTVCHEQGYLFQPKDYGLFIESREKNLACVVSRQALVMKGHAQILNIHNLTINQCFLTLAQWTSLFAPSSHAYPLLEGCCLEDDDAHYLFTKVVQNLTQLASLENRSQSLTVVMKAILEELEKNALPSSEQWKELFVFCVRPSCPETALVLDQITSFPIYSSLFPNSANPGNRKSLCKYQITSLKSPDEISTDQHFARDSQKHFHISDQFKDIVEKVKISIRAQKDSRVLVCGVKDSGKSSTLRQLLNVLLSPGHGDSTPLVKTVAYLDVDIGQSEFTPSGLVSLTLVHCPRFGPPFTHWLDGKQAAPTIEILSQCYVGVLSPANCPEFYIECVKFVYRAYTQLPEPRPPLLVNTMGWMEGLGLRCLASTIALTSPRVIVQIQGKHKNRNAPPLDSRFLETLKGIESSNGIFLRPSPTFIVVESSVDASGGRSSLGAPEHRNVTLLSHLLCSLGQAVVSLPLPGLVNMRNNIYANEHSIKSGNPDGRLEASFLHLSPNERVIQWFLALQPRHCKWSDSGSLFLKVMNWRSDIPETALSVLQVFNASLVALCEVPTSRDAANIKWLDVEQSSGHVDENDAFMPNAQSKAAASLSCKVPSLKQNPICECLGLGIVRAIDFSNRTLLVLSHLPDERLARVNCLLKGVGSLPPCLLVDQPSGLQTFYVEKPQNIGVGRTAIPNVRKFLNVRRHQH